MINISTIRLYVAHMEGKEMEEEGKKASLVQCKLVIWIYLQRRETVPSCNEIVLCYFVIAGVHYSPLQDCFC